MRNVNGNFIILSRNISFAGNPSCNEMRKSEFMTRFSFLSLKMSYHLVTWAADYWQYFPAELAIFEPYKKSENYGFEQLSKDKTS